MMPETASGRERVAASSRARSGFVERLVWIAWSQARREVKRASAASSEVNRIS